MKFFERLRKFSQYIEITHTPPPDTVESSPEIDNILQPDPLQDAIADLKEAMQKLGRIQLRANTLAESDRKEIKQMLQVVAPTSTGPQKETLQELLLVVDRLEDMARLNSNNDAWADGFRMVHERLLRILEKWDVVPIESVGQPFAPHLHHALDVTYTNEVAENTVVAEQRRGYLYGEDVLRYAEVVVARKRDNIE
jgi:molecular chaperone GrpE